MDSMKAFEKSPKNSMGVGAGTGGGHTIATLNVRCSGGARICSGATSVTSSSSRSSALPVGS
ncbi:MAG: hypothetical protein R2711_14920 [Acidimicrobiales bacterium]